MADATCSIEGCGNPVRARGWCIKHWKRWHKHGDPLIVHPKGAATTPEAEAERRRKIGDATRGKKFVRSEEYRQRLSEQLRGRTLSEEHKQAVSASLRAVRDQTAATSRAQWEKWREETGQSLSYSGAHRRVRTARGPAKFQTCVTCGRGARHWAHVHDTDPGDPQNYQAMCQRCHIAYDGTTARSLATKGPEGRRAIAFKAWETKRRKRVQQDVAPDPALARVHDGEPEHVGDAAEL